MSNNLMGRVWDFLGLVEDEDGWTPPSGTPGMQSTSSGNVRLISSVPADQPIGASLPRSPRESHSRGRPAPSGPETETEVLQVDGFGDCSHLTSWYKGGIPVMMDLRFLSAPIAQGVVYYATGLTSYDKGKVTQVGDGLVLVTPPGTRVSESEKVRLAKIGMWPSTGD